VPMGIVASPRAIGDYQRDLPLVYDLPVVYATQVLDKNHTGFISIKQIAKDPVLLDVIVPLSIGLIQ